MVDFYQGGLSCSTLQAMVAVLALGGDRSGSLRGGSVSAFIDILCPKNSSEGGAMLARHADCATGRIAFRTRLAHTLREVSRYRARGAGAEVDSDTRPLDVAAATRDFVAREAPPSMGSILSTSDLSCVAIPVIDLLSGVRGPYLVDRIPPHLGHGVTRYLTPNNAESIKKEMEWEAGQDRTAASMLLKSLKAFAVDPTVSSLQNLLRVYSGCGEWRGWIAQPAKPETPHPEAQQVVANTIALLEAFQKFASEYLEALSPTPPADNDPLPWFERDVREVATGARLLPLYAGVLEILARQDVLKVSTRPASMADGSTSLD